ncbi:hypothetical protein ACFWY9_04115 [Amycolatopsis sp. NPDC059027]|uniref:hypothetical protein n=1 Tax=unclassified Amycolatopsis TaxID=2618356 RepID=UPI00366CA12A
MAADDVVLDPADWDSYAGRLRANNNAAQLVEQLQAALVPESVFGTVAGGAAAAARLRGAIAETVRELQAIGVNIEELASNAIAAGKIAQRGALSTEQQARAAKAHRLDVESGPGR